MTDLTIPAFLDRKLNPHLNIRERFVPSKIKPRTQMEIDLERAWGEAEKMAIIERYEAKALAEKEERARLRRLKNNGRKIYLAAKLENSPLAAGEHTVELLHLGRKWVRFRVAGRKNAVRIRRVIWNAIDRGPA